MEIWNRRNPVGGAPIVDSALDVNSEHCVQNKVVAEQFSAINSTLSMSLVIDDVNVISNASELDNLRNGVFIAQANVISSEPFWVICLSNSTGSVRKQIAYGYRSNTTKNRYFASGSWNAWV